MPDSPVIAVTPGEPAGVGPELCVRLAARDTGACLVFVADPGLLEACARSLALSFVWQPWEGRARATPGAHVLSVPLTRPVTPGRLDAGNAGYVLATLEQAIDGCLAGEFDALVTGPVHKGVINDAGIAFTGHTELLGERCGAEPVMMLACPGLRVALATTHLPLREVSRHITRERVERVLRVLHRDLVGRFGIADPVVAVCGLNPHAGESGHLGREEIEIITPVLDRLRGEDMRLQGPLPADTAFLPRHLAGVDAVLAMYHDQGLPVLKHHDFAHAVNITLGLPFPRTSVDHGTALELAGTGRADPSSLYAALETAMQMAQPRMNADKRR